MRNSVLWGLVLLPAITLALVYYPMLAKLSVALVSPYAKADLTRRVLAAAVDGTLVATLLALYGNSTSLFYVFAGAAYLLLRERGAGAQRREVRLRSRGHQPGNRSPLRARRFPEPERPLRPARGQYHRGVPGGGHRRAEILKASDWETGLP